MPTENTTGLVGIGQSGLGSCHGEAAGDRGQRPCREQPLPVAHRGRARRRWLVRESSDLRGLEGVDVERKHGDILDAESVRAAARGAQSVFNVAAVYATSGHSVEEIMRPAVEGTENVLRAAAAEGVERVVQTSTTGAIGFSHSPEIVLNETHWNDDPQMTYFVAKTKSERLAWQIADELDIDMVTVNPTGILGQYDYRITPSTSLVRGFLEGSSMSVQGGVNIVDVRDVARGHLLALRERDVEASATCSSLRTTRCATWRRW